MSWGRGRPRGTCGRPRSFRGSPRVARPAPAVYDWPNRAKLSEYSMSTVIAVAREPAPARLVRAEAAATLGLAVPLAATQLAQMAINTTDVLMLGRLGPEPL